MEAGLTDSGTGRAQRSHANLDSQAGPDQLNRKRRRITKDDEDVVGYTCKKPRIQAGLTKQRHTPHRRVVSQPSRKSLPPQEIRDLDQQDRACNLNGERVENRYHCTSKSQTQSRTTSPRTIQQNKHPARAHLTTREDNPLTRAVERGPLTEINLRAHTDSSMPRRKEAAAAPSFASTSSSISTTTDKSFGIQLNKNNIFYGRVKTVKPSDYESVQEYLNRQRESKSPDENDYKQYVEQVEYAENEQSRLCNAWPRLAKPPGHTPSYTTNYNYQWTEVESPLTYKLSDAKPDISESFRTDQYPLKAREALGSALTPTQYSGAMPTFCAEWKGPDGLLPSAEKQCAYDGALMVHAAHEAHEYMRKPSPEFFNKTQAITVALNGDFVQQYSNHMVKRGGCIEYHQYPLRTNQPGESLDDFKETYRRVRNCQDWARERAARTKDDLHIYTNAEPEAAESTWIWSVENSRYYRTLSNGSVQWAPLAASDPAITPPSTTASSDQALGIATRRGKGKKALLGAASRTHP